MIQAFLDVLAVIAALWAMFLPSRHALHMFQQNRYETGRYSGWIRENLKDSLHSSLVPCVFAVLSVLTLFSGDHLFRSITVLVLLCLLAFYEQKCEKKRSYIKPLVVTARVKRQIVVLVILETVCAACIAYVDIPFLLVPAAVLLPWILIWPVGWITAPVEKAVQKSFINDAKRILNEHTGLIKIGITGSYGKTTTKNIMQAMLSETYTSLMTPASYNTPMGITRTIREQLKPVDQVFICEMGADHVGDISELMDFVHPSIGVVTAIGPQHLNTFGSQENITREKMQMIEKLPADGTGILNYDNELIRSWKIQNPVRIITYGVKSRDVDYYADEITYSQHGSAFTVVHDSERIRIETKLLGELNILNILSAVAAARVLNLSWKDIQKACRTMHPVEHRLEPKMIGGLRFIDDAFNANPAGSAMALEVLSMMPGKRIIVTPGMIDLGSRQYEINEHFGTLMKGKADFVLLVGKEQTGPIYEGLKKSGFNMDHVMVVDTEKEAFASVRAQASSEDTILLENDLPDAFNH